jgi:ABC-type sugar transport system ATPase subunit
MTPFTEGELLVNGRGVRFKNPGDAWLAGVAIGGPDRDAAGCLLHLEKPAGFSVAHVVERLQAPFLEMEKFGGFKMPRQSDIPIQSLRRVVRYLAGGGAEKKRIARWLSSRARVLILLEPTRGLEAGARLAFYRMIDDLAAARLGVILVDSNHTELQALSDRIVEL